MLFNEGLGVLPLEFVYIESSYSSHHSSINYVYPESGVLNLGLVPTAVLLSLELRLETRWRGGLTALVAERDALFWNLWNI